MIIGLCQLTHINTQNCGFSTIRSVFVPGGIEMIIIAPIFGYNRSKDFFVWGEYLMGEELNYIVLTCNGGKNGYIAEDIDTHIQVHGYDYYKTVEKLKDLVKELKKGA